MIKAIIFDVDGVLLDSYESTYIYFKTLGKLLNLKVPSKHDFHKKYYALPTRVMLRSLNKIKNLTDLDKQLKKVSGKITQHVKHFKLFEGSNEVLKELHKKYKLGLATSRSKVGLETYLKFAKTKKFFKAMVGVHHVKNHKPHPEPLLLVAKKLRVKPTEAIYIGDAPTDLQAARAAGMKVIIYGNKKVKGADAYISHFYQLIPAINKLL